MTDVEEPRRHPVFAREIARQAEVLVGQRATGGDASGLGGEDRIKASTLQEERAGVKLRL